MNHTVENYNCTSDVKQMINITNLLPANNLTLEVLENEGNEQFACCV